MSAVAATPAAAGAVNAAGVPLAPPAEHLALPFFDAPQRTLALRLAGFIVEQPEARAPQAPHADDVDAACRDWVARLGAAGLLRYCVAAADGGALAQLDSRALVLAREALAYADPLADFAFAMQGLGSGALTLEGSAAQRARWLPRVAEGRAIAAFALSEPEAGSDVAAIDTRAARLPDGSWRLDGRKTWISNGGIADFYCLFARSGAAGSGTAGLSCFLLPADTPGLRVAERIDTLAPHPLATLELDGCVLPADALVGSEGAGFKLAMRTLDIFRASVAAAALGMARRALAEALAHARRRRMFGATLADLQLTQARLGELAAALDGAALLTYRAAWLRDAVGLRTTREAAMAKLQATEVAQQLIDAALQLHGGLGVKVGSRVEALYRDIRALRIYEGASEVQRLIVGRELLKSAAAAGKP
jgi:acyl-CoA dehydrogenase